MFMFKKAKQVWPGSESAPERRLSVHYGEDGHQLVGFHYLMHSLDNKGTSFTMEEREHFNLRGLVPPCDPLSLEDKVELSMLQLRSKATPLDKYIFLHTIQDSDETLFYALIVAHTAEIMPLVYTPTVGTACLEWSHIYRQTPRGVYISARDRGHVKEILNNFPNKDIKVIVFTDGERILGLGDLGSNGMGIPVGKLALYTACAGIHPRQCLPVMIDVGTNTQSIRDDKFYIGLRQPRERGPLYDELIQEFMDATTEVYGRNVLLQFEDFGNSNAFRLLEKYRNKVTCFNDDIQGTASVVLAGLYASLPMVKKETLSQHKFVFQGAGEAGIGIAELISSAIKADTGCSIEEARKSCWFVDSKGLITSKRLENDGKLEHHKLAFAHEWTHSEEVPLNLLGAVKVLRPTALVGVSAQRGAFSTEVLQFVSSINEHPLIFALSNPTTKAECTAEEAYVASDGKAVFASGSPFDPVTLPDGRHFVPGQGNNAYIFPGVGLGSLMAQALTLTDEDMLVAARALAATVSQEQRDLGCSYPKLDSIRDVSVLIAVAVAKNIVREGRSSATDISKEDAESDEFWKARAKELVYVPHY